MPIPTWEISKELADKLPGDKGDQKEEKCPECGADLEKEANKDKKAF